MSLSYYEGGGGYRGSPGRSPMRAVHDLSTSMYPDSDSGFSSTFRTKSRGFTSDDFTMQPSRSRAFTNDDFTMQPSRSRAFTNDDFTMPPTRLTRSRSMTRLNHSGSRDTSPTGSVASFSVAPDSSMRNLHDNLEDSETRRSVLVHKLKEAQETLTLQNDRLSKIETTAKENAVLVEDLKFKEREYRAKICSLEQAEEDKDQLRMENVRLRQEMQDRITALDFQLKSLQSQHQSHQVDNKSRSNLLDQTTSCLSLLEEENTKLQKERDLLQDDVGSLKELLQVTKSQLGSVTEDKNNVMNSLDTVTQENGLLSKKLHEMAGQMVELRTLLQAVQDENERLSNNWKNLTQDKHRTSKQIENFHDTVADLKARLSTTSADKDRLFQEKLDLNHKLQQLVLDKEQLIKVKLSLEDTIGDHQSELSKSRMSINRRQDDAKKVEEELQGVKRVSQELSMELSSVKAFYERALEQISLLENGKKMQQQHLELSEQEKRRLQGEVDRLTQVMDGRSREDRKDRELLEDSVDNLKTELKQIRNDKALADNKNRELEMKLQHANEELHRVTAMQQEEMLTWKTTCERLTSAVSRKEAELEGLNDKSRDTESVVRRLKEELQVIREQYEMMVDDKEERDRLQTENRRLQQERAENEQMIKLLETQKEVLTKSTESSLNKLHDVEHLSGKVEQLRAENDLLRVRISELEKVRDNLIKQKEDVLANSELIYKQPGLDDLERKIDELRSANKQLREINDVMSDKLEVLEQENARLKQAGIAAPSQTSDTDRSRRAEQERVLKENSQLKQDLENLNSRHQRMVINYGHEESLEKGKKDMVQMRKENVALQKQVQLMTGQMSLVEGSKKRLEDTVNQQQETISRLKARITEDRGSGSQAQASDLQEELRKVKEQLSKVKVDKKKLKEELEEERTKKPTQIRESLEDVGEELHQMRGELHKLMGEIEGKDRDILDLENQLRKSRDELDLKEKGMGDLRRLTEDLEEQNRKLKVNIDATEDEPESGNIIRLKRGTRAPMYSSSPTVGSSSSSHRPNSPSKSLKDELQDALKKKENSQVKIQTSDPQLSRKFLEAKPSSKGGVEQGKPSPASGKYGAQFFFKPDKSATEGSGRLQSLISKYRSHSDAPPAGEETEKKSKPFSFTTGRLGLKGKGVTLTTPKVPDSKSSQPGLTKPGVIRSASKGPPPPTLPKPKVKQDVIGGAAKPQGGSVNDGEGAVGETHDTTLQDSQEQKDINALIQKRAPKKPVLSVHPPKLTSKAIAGLLRRPSRGSQGAAE